MAGGSHRKLWIEFRLKELAEILAVAVGGFSVMDNHLHLVLRLDPDAAETWTAHLTKLASGASRADSSREAVSASATPRKTWASAARPAR